MLTDPNPDTEAEGAEKRPQNPDLLTYEEAARRLGGDANPVHHATVYRLAQRGEIALIQIGRVRRFSATSIDRYLKRQARKRP